MDAANGGTDESSAGSGGEDVTAPNCDCPAPTPYLPPPPPRPLECLCGPEVVADTIFGADGVCPGSVEDVVANSYLKCSVITIREGCGLRVVDEGRNGPRYRYWFDIETGALVGAYLANDLNFLDCGSRWYDFGEPEEACEQYSECVVCPGDIELPTCE